MSSDDYSGVLYEIWDYESRNLLADFESRIEALAMVRDVVERYGRDYVAQWALGRMDDEGIDEPLLEGLQLADEALKSVTR